MVTLNPAINYSSEILQIPKYKILWNFILWNKSIGVPVKVQGFLSTTAPPGLPWGFPGGAVVESLPASAGDTGSSPGLGRSHMPRSGWAREPQLLSLRVWSSCSATREAATVRGPRTAMKSGPRSPGESPRTETKTQHSHK